MPDRLEKEGFSVTTSEEAGKRNLKAKNVVFSAPPTGNSQYADDVRRAVQEVGSSLRCNLTSDDENPLMVLLLDLGGFLWRRSSGFHIFWWSLRRERGRHY